MSARVTRLYGAFRGVDFRSEETDLTRSPDALNVWKDYKKGEGIRTRPALKKEIPIDGKVNGVFFFKAAETEMIILHCGTALYKIIGEKKELFYEGVNDSRSNAFVFNNAWYFIDGKNYLKFDGEKIGEVEGYVPTTSIDRTPEGGGTVKQDVNLLSDYRINTFVGDGVSTMFALDSQNLSDSEAEVYIDDVAAEQAGYTCTLYATSGYMKITPAPPEAAAGKDNISIKFKKNSDRSKITNCTLVEVFDNRVFFSGNPMYPNVIFHSALENPAYCSDLDGYNEGLDSADVRGMVAGNNALWVFREPSQSNTTIFYHVPTTNYEYGKIYPNTHSSISTGCIGKAINFNDDIVFFSDRGMEGISGDITTEQVIAHRSSLVDSRLITEKGYADMILTEWEGYLLVCIGKRIYLADSRATFTKEDHFEYEWFFWEIEKNITAVRVHKRKLYIGTEDGLFSLSDYEGGVESFWVTPKDKFGYPQHMKTSNKKGCVVEAEGDLSLSAKTEKNSEFSLCHRAEGITDYFVARVKFKKFKDIQLKFHSTTRFGLEQATLESFVGGYIKR